jgi:hypothetical protein
MKGKNQSLLSSRSFSNKEVVPNADIMASLDRPIPSPLSPVKGELEEGASEDVHLIHAKLSSSASQIFVSEKFGHIRLVASAQW